MLGYSFDKFGCFITNIEDDIAFVTLCGKDDDKSYMEIPIDDLKDNGIVCKPGMIFRLTATQFLGWQKICFIPLPKVPVTLEEIKKLRKDYAEKYGDV
jgi:hypothetical protein